MIVRFVREYKFQVRVKCYVKFVSGLYEGKFGVLMIEPPLNYTVFSDKEACPECDLIREYCLHNCSCKDDIIIEEVELILEPVSKETGTMNFFDIDGMMRWYVSGSRFHNKKTITVTEVPQAPLRNDLFSNFLD